MVELGKLTATEYAGIDFFVCFLWLYILISQEKMKGNGAILPHIHQIFLAFARIWSKRITRLNIGEIYK